jgi:hypothetical protein
LNDLIALLDPIIAWKMSNLEVDFKDDKKKKKALVGNAKEILEFPR